VDELRADAVIEYTDTGRLLGHLVLGCICVHERARRLGQFPALKLDLLLHMILSHHGQREFGSPVLPAIPEALALHHLDNLDAKTNAARRLLDKDANQRSRWTERSWMLDTALFKGNANG
ncbi:MAG: HD family phosphohydrolase, partial [Planctomycetota bacterium]|nr:HD family phosphohydrolase [Planctomycetota bacterium]